MCVIEREEERERESRVYGPSYFGGKKAEEIFRKDSNHFLNTHTHTLSKKVIVSVLNKVFYVKNFSGPRRKRRRKHYDIRGDCKCINLYVI